MLPPGVALPLPARAAPALIGSAVLALLAGFAMTCFAALAMPTCGWTECGRVPWAAIGMGLGLAQSIVVWMQRTATVSLAVLAAGAWWLAMREGQPPTWVTVGAVLLVSGGLIMVLVPWLDIAELRRRRAAGNATSSTQQPPPAEGRLARVAPRTATASIVLLALGSGLLWWLVERRLPWWFGSEGVWYVWASVAVGLGLGLGWRAFSLNRSRRRFLDSPQPVRSVQITEHPTGVYVRLAGSAIAHFPTTARFAAKLQMEGGPRYIWRGANMRSGREQPALLYGDPGAIHWCAVVIGSRLLAPFGATEILAERADSDIYANDDEPDRSVGPGSVHTHRLAGNLAYILVPLSVATIAAIAAMVGCVGFVRELHASVSVLAALALAVLGMEIVWRVLVRPRFAWNDSGIAVVTGSGVEYLPWRSVSSIERDEGVKLVANRGNHLIATHRLGRWLAPGERNPQQLIADLRDSKRRAERTPAAYRPAPPELDYPSRSPVLWALGSGSAIALAYLLLAVTNSSR